MTAPAADALVLFGVTGDLARKKLFPALYELERDGRLGVPVLGVARSDWSEDRLRDRLRESLPADAEPDVQDRLCRRLGYQQGDYDDPAVYRAIAERLGPVSHPVAYLAVPPVRFEDVITGLGAAGFARGGRVVVEKPFGRDLESARHLNEVVHRTFDESAVYRIDHFLGKESVLNLLVFRFANSIFEPVWNRQHIASVQVTLAEDFGTEGRAGFYDGVGALRDVVQNHLLEVVSLLAMEPPASRGADELRDEKVKVLRSVAPLDPSLTIRGQYQGYRQEEGVDPCSDTETFAAIRLQIDNWRWAGVPWCVRAGKAMATTVTEAVVTFTQPPTLLFGDGGGPPQPTQLRFRFKPDDRISLVLQAKQPGPELLSEPVELGVDYGEAVGPSPDAYVRLLADALSGDQRWFARQDGVEEAWRIVQPVLDHPDPVVPYAPGSWGPDVADCVLPAGRRWDW